LVVIATARFMASRVAADAQPARAPYGIWLPLQLTRVRSLMLARRDAGSRALVLSLPYPDGVGPALAPLGLAPDLGAGNVTETATKLELLAGEGAEARLVMHHAAQRYAFTDFAPLGGREQDEPPWTAEVRVGSHVLTDERV